MTNECEICGMDCGEGYFCETCLDDIAEYPEPTEMDEWDSFDPDC